MARWHHRLDGHEFELLIAVMQLHSNYIAVTQLTYWMDAEEKIITSSKTVCVCCVLSHI